MIEDGKYVLIHYVGSFENGKVFDSSINKQPFEFQIGKNQVIQGMEEAVKTMSEKEEKEVTVPPEKAYGAYDPLKKKRFPIAEIRKSFKPVKGMTIGLKNPQGGQIPANVTDVTDTEVEIDINHPYAGKTLKFRIILLEVNDSPKYEIQHIVCDDCTCDGQPDSCENQK